MLARRQWVTTSKRCAGDRHLTPIESGIGSPLEAAMAAEVGAMMASKALRVLVPGLLLPTLMGHAGGWAVITVDDLPDYVEAGKPVALSYMVRQHGQTALEGLRGRVEAKSGRLNATGTVRPTEKIGRYTASLTLPSAGDWTITIRSGFGPSDVTLLPLQVVDHAARPRTITDTERGARLFVSKGCVTCHEQIAVGPRLEGERFDVAYISGFLANPPATPSQPGGKATMPNLGLAQREIASLVAYLNSDKQVSKRE